MIRNEELESTIICGTIYRHPKMSLELFNKDFLDPMLEKIDKENKYCFLLDDFNIDLLKCETVCEYSDFYNHITSSFF